MLGGNRTHSCFTFCSRCGLLWRAGALKPLAHLGGLNWELQPWHSLEKWIFKNTFLDWTGSCPCLFWMSPLKCRRFHPKLDVAVHLCAETGSVLRGSSGCTKAAAHGGTCSEWTGDAGRRNSQSPDTKRPQPRNLTPPNAESHRPSNKYKVRVCF